MKRISAWTTDDEIRFLDGLGRWSESAAMTRHQLLKSYLGACIKRANWEYIDPNEIAKHCRMLLKREPSSILR